MNSNYLRWLDGCDDVGWTVVECKANEEFYGFCNDSTRAYDSEKIFFEYNRDNLQEIFEFYLPILVDLVMIGNVPRAFDVELWFFYVVQYNLQDFC